MLISVLGTPTPLGHWGFAAVRKVARFLLGDCHDIHTDSLEGFKAGMSGRGSRSVIFSSDAPLTTINELLIKLNTPVIVFQDEIEDTIAFLMNVRMAVINEATAVAFHNLTALKSLERSQHRLVFTKADYDQNAAAVLERCARMIIPDLPPARMAEMAEQLLIDAGTDGGGSLRDQIERSGWPADYLAHTFRAHWSEETSGRVDSLVNRFLPMLRGELSKVAVDPAWLEFDKSCDPKTGVMDLTGPQRRLITGPVLYLPTGNWIVELQFESADNFSGNRVNIAVCNQKTELAVARTKLPSRGVFACEIPFAVQDGDVFVTLNFDLVSGAIEGHFALRSMIFRRLVESDRDTLPIPNSKTRAIAASPKVGAAPS